MNYVQEIAQLKVELNCLAESAARERDLRIKAEKRAQELAKAIPTQTPGTADDKLKDARTTLRKLAKTSDCHMSRHWAERCLNRIGFI